MFRRLTVWFRGRANLRNLVSDNLDSFMKLERWWRRTGPERLRFSLFLKKPIYGWAKANSSLESGVQIKGHFKRKYFKKVLSAQGQRISVVNTQDLTPSLIRISDMRYTENQDWVNNEARNVWDLPEMCEITCCSHFLSGKRSWNAPVLDNSKAISSSNCQRSMWMHRIDEGDVFPFGFQK